MLNDLKKMTRRNDLIFIVLLLVISFLYGYHEILFARPAYLHWWRQMDCLSITMNYYMDNRDFFRPAMHYAGLHGGRTISEFPIIYFTVGQLWKVFGHHEWLFRLIDLSIVFTGLFSLYRFGKEFLKSDFWGISTPLFLFSSQILGYYSFSFLADAPALGLVLIASYFYWKGMSKQSSNWYYLSFLFFLLAGLLKITALLFLIALLCIQLYRTVAGRNPKNWGTSFVRLWPYVAVFALIVSWYSYVRYYNSHNNNGLFLNGILPIWGIDAKARAEVWKMFTIVLLPRYFYVPALLFVVSAFLSLFIFIKKVNRFLFALSILVFFGCIGFIILFYQVFNVHDYYLTNLLVFVPIPVITLLDMLRRNFPSIFNSIYVKTVFACGVILMLYLGAVHTRKWYFPEQPFVQNSILVSKSEIQKVIDYKGWCDSHLKAYETIKPYIRSLGIKRDDLVYSTWETSLNGSLYLMDQKGFTDFYIIDIPDDQRIPALKSYGVKYLFLNYPECKEKAFMAPYRNNLIGKYKNIEIYNITH